MRKRVLTLALALCMAAMNTTGAFAAATEGAVTQIAEEEIIVEENTGADLEEAEAEPVENSDQSITEAEVGLAENYEQTITEPENNPEYIEEEITEAEPGQEDVPEPEDTEDDVQETDITNISDSIENADISGITDKVYTGSEVTQSITVTFGNTELVEDRDYTVSYSNNINAGTATVMITGEGSYTGTVEKTFTIEKAERNIEASLSEEAVVIGSSTKIIINNAEGNYFCMSEDDTVATVSGATVTSKKVGVAKISITSEETDNFKETTKELEIRVLPGASSKVTVYNVAQGLKVTWVKVEGATRYYVYRDGEHIKTTSGLEITDGDVKYRSGEKFTYKVVATAKDVGDSTVARTGTYYRLMPVGIKSVTNSGAGKMTVTYDKSPGSSGYVVRYGLKSDMSDAKVITVKGEDTTKRTFSNLTMGKLYYVQVRTYKIENDIRYYSGYCTTKTVKIKKMVPAYEVTIDYWLSTIDVAKGYTKKLDVIVRPYDTTDKVTFTSSNTKVATVSSTGVIKGISKGKATITVKATSGKKDSITVNVVDNVRTWAVDYNLKYYDYGEPTVAPMKMYYSGNKLVFETLVVNNRIFYADKFDYINITLYDSNGKQIAKKKFTNIWLGIAAYGTKKVTFTFDSATKADIIEGDYDYDYWYTYSY